MPPKKKRKVESTTSAAKQSKKSKQDNQSSKSENSKALKQVQYTRWLMKSEPESRFEKGVDVKFGIEDLKREPNQTACWDGVRNYQIVKESYVDDTQFDPKDPHYDQSAKKENPKWFMVDVKFVRMMNRFISLKELKSLHLEHKASGGPLKSLALFTSARLSVQPVTEDEFEFICSLEDKEGNEA
ncbi:thymocyte nuclear protein 1-like isoform X3 [Acropora palmata]|uniref:thymocyte nuclear protein 1-like isoform X3 n=1 Tax=Acropora palmata TaxID=6131 RepID=UPI003DA0C297